MTDAFFLYKLLTALVSPFAPLKIIRHRVINMTDSIALLQPNVELACWLLDILLYLEYPDVYNLSVYLRLCNCLRAANLPLKETIFKILNRILIKWVDVLEDKNTTDEETEGVHAIRECVSKHLVASRVQGALLKRLAYERRQDRLLFSSFLRNGIEFFLSLLRLQQVIIETAAPARDDNVKTLESAREEEKGDEEQEDGEVMFIPQMEGPKLVQTSEGALQIQWHDPSFLTLMGNKIGSVVYELQMAER